VRVAVLRREGVWCVVVLEDGVPGPFFVAAGVDLEGGGVSLVRLFLCTDVLVMVPGSVGW